MSNIIYRDGNVIAADFNTRPNPDTSLAISFKSAVLYFDEAVCLMRISYFLNGQLIGVQHLMVESA